MTEGGQGSEGDATPAGWYADAQGAYRWWSGTAWTEHTLAPPADAPTAEVPDLPLPPPPAERRNRPVAVVVTAVLAVAAVVVGLVVVLTRGDDPPPTTGTTPTSLDPSPIRSPSDSETPSQSSTPTSAGPTSSSTSSPTSPPTTPPRGGPSPTAVTRDLFTQIAAHSCTVLRDTTAAFDEQFGYSPRACRTDPNFFGSQDRSGCSLTLSAADVTGAQARLRFIVGGAEGCASRGEVGVKRVRGRWFVDTLTAQS